MSRRFVSPMTRTLSRAWMPSSLERSWFTTCRRSGLGGGGVVVFVWRGRAFVGYVMHGMLLLVIFWGGACMCVGYVIHGKGVGGRRLVLLSFFLYKKRVSVGRVKSVSSFFFQSKSVSVLDVGVYKQQ